MGIYSEYLDSNFNFKQLTAERKKHLKRVADIRGKRAIFTYAAALTKNAAISIIYDDLLPISYQLSNIKEDKIDIIIETPGGSAEIAEDIVKLIRGKFSEVAMIVPGYAKSAGTIMVMAGDEILLEPIFWLSLNCKIFLFDDRWRSSRVIPARACPMKADSATTSRPNYPRWRPGETAMWSPSL